MSLARGRMVITAAGRMAAGYTSRRPRGKDPLFPGDLLETLWPQFTTRTAHSSSQTLAALNMKS